MAAGIGGLWVLGLAVLAAAASGATLRVPVPTFSVEAFVWWGDDRVRASLTVPTSVETSPTPTPWAVAPGFVAATPTPLATVPPALPRAWTPGERVEVGFLQLSDLPGDRWERFRRSTSAWATRQSSAWGGVAYVGPQMRIDETTLGLAESADAGRVAEGWRALLGPGGAQPGPLPAAGRAELAGLLSVPNTYTPALTIETVTPVPARYPNPAGGSWSFDVIVGPDRTTMEVDAFAWQAGRFATLLTVVHRLDAPPIDMQELLRRAQARVDAAQKAN